MNVLFALVEPESPENVGAAARAINTMGFCRLVLVGDGSVKDSRVARYVAHGSEHILDEALVFPSVAALGSAVDLMIGTTNAARSLHRPFYSGEVLGPRLAELKDQLGMAAIVFGRESRGLTNDELEACDAASSLELSRPYPALNLGQSVMLYAYLLSRALRGAPPIETPARQVVADEPSGGALEYAHLKNTVAKALDRLGVSPDSKNYKKVMGRLPGLDFATMRLAQHLCQRLERALGNK